MTIRNKPNQLIIKLLCILCIGAFSCSEKEELVVFDTDMGEMVAVLYDETAQHKANFLKLVKEGKYDSVLFHRVIEEFMIQTGDIGTGKFGEAVDYRIPAEFYPEKYIHDKGSLAAARVGDAVNPQKESSGSQFYIVHGKTFDEEGLRERADRRQYLKLYGLFERMLRSKRFPELTEKYNYHIGLYEEDSTYDISAAQRNLIFQSVPIIEKQFGDQKDPGYPEWAKEIYASEGGAPHLDGEYTVFGKIISGMEVIDKIATTDTDERDKPLNEIRMNVQILKLSRAEIESRFNYKFDQ